MTKSATADLVGASPESITTISAEVAPENVLQYRGYGFPGSPLRGAPE